MEHTMPADRLRARLRRDLAAAMKAGESEEVAAIRSLIGAIDAAEAVGVQPGARPAATTSEHFAGAVAGGAAAETPRRELGEGDLERILDAEISDRSENAERYAALGRPDEAHRLRVQADWIVRYRRAPDET
jgi:uncharacterized protein YqeY